MNSKSNSLEISMQNRYQYIDVIKGIGILLVVFQHCLGGGTLGSFLPGVQKAIAGFHMPLFFFISGFLYRLKDSKVYLYRKMCTLVFPYLLVQIINYVCEMVTKVISVIFCIDNFYHLIKLEGYWFIETLIYISCMYFLVDSIMVQYIKRDKVQKILKFIVLIIFISVGLVYSFFAKSSFSIITCSLIAYFFFGVGNMSRILSEHIPKNVMPILRNRLSCLTFGAIFLIFEYLVSKQNSLVTMARNEYGNPFIFFVSSIFGILSIWLLGISVNSNKILEYYGKNSLIILTTQFPIYRLVYIVLNMVIISGEETINKVLCFSLTAFLEVFVIKFVNKYFPIFAGKFRY